MLRTFIFKYTWLAVALLVLLLSIMPVPAQQGASWVQTFQVDKIFHYLSHAIIILAYFSPKILVKQSFPNNKTLLIAFLALLMYGVAIEFIQKYAIINRHFDVLDIAANTLGDFTGIGITKYMSTRTSTK